jgi:thiosulfate dehydrogenase (quinone)
MTDGASQRVATTIAATGAEDWRAAALVLLPVRVIQGFIYWDGGSWRFIYAPGKLDPHAPIWMANKFQSALPGALLGMDHVVAFFLASVSVGRSLQCGGTLRRPLFDAWAFTRAAAATAVFSVVLMLMFDWQGAICIDEWTMAACNCESAPRVDPAPVYHFNVLSRRSASRPCAE